MQAVIEFTLQDSVDLALHLYPALSGEGIGDNANIVMCLAARRSACMARMTRAVIDNLKLRRIKGCC